MQSHFSACNRGSDLSVLLLVCLLCVCSFVDAATITSTSSSSSSSSSSSRGMSGGNGGDPGSHAIFDAKNDREEQFMMWLRDMAVQTTNVDLANFTNPVFTNFKLRGLKATRSIALGEEIISVPKEVILAAEFVPTTHPIFALLNDNPSRFTNELKLTALVLYELQQETSLWAPYFEVLPTRFFTPCEFPPEVMRQLEGSPLYGDTEERQKTFELEFASLFPLATQQHPDVFHQDASTFAAFKYARLVVQTRAFLMKMDGKEVLGIVPLADMLNHTPDAKIRWEYDQTTHAFKLFAMQPYTSGMQVYNNYGQRSNRRLLLDFGFIVPDNPFDFVPFPAPLISATDSERMKILEKMGYHYAREYPIRLGQLSDELFFVTRIAHASPQELESLRRQIELKAFRTTDTAKLQMAFNSSISVANELSSLQWVRNTSLTQLEAYHDSYENDVALMEGGSDLDRNSFHAVFVRHIEKRIFVSISEFASVHIPLLEMLYALMEFGPETRARIAMTESDFVENVLIPLASSAIPPQKFHT